jgi:hypothetical protein
MIFLLLTIVAISPLPWWWWIKGPGLGDPSPVLSISAKIVMLIAAIGGGLLTAQLLGTDLESTKAIAAYAGGSLGSRLALVALNPQPLPPKDSVK